MNFKDQLETWEKIFASSGQLEDRQVYLSELAKQEAAFERELEILSERADVIGEGVNTDLKYLRQAHENLSGEYRGALISLPESDLDTKADARERLAQLEEKHLAALEKIVRNVRSVGDQAISQDLDDMTKVRSATIAISYLTVAVGLVLVPIFLVWLYRNYIALDKARKEAWEASIAKSEFVNNVSHEIRTPLNGVIGLLDVMKETELSKDQQDYLETISCSSQTMAAVLDDIIDYSKIEARIIDLNPRTFPVKTTVSSVIDLFAPLAQEKNLDVRLRFAENLPEKVNCDELRFRQVLLNLVHNAVSYTKKGHVEIRVGWKSDPNQSKTGSLAVEVEDTGMGIESSLIENLFKPFNQSSTSTERLDGTGLGLSLCKHLVELMEGSIYVESVYQKGSTFFFSVKAEDCGKIDAELIRPSNPRSADSYNTMDSNDLNNARILIAEDNAVNSKVATLLINQLGLQPDVVVNGAEAVQAFMAHHYDIILMDLQMPIMSGEQATRKIRQCTGDGEAPWIIALTASAMTQNREEAYEAGMNDFMPKPMNAEALRLALTKAFAKVKGSKESQLASVES